MQRSSKRSAGLKHLINLPDQRVKVLINPTAGGWEFVNRCQFETMFDLGLVSDFSPGSICGSFSGEAEVESCIYASLMEKKGVEGRRG